MTVLQVVTFAVVAFACTVSGQHDCDNLLTNYCRCLENPVGAKEAYVKAYNMYYKHIREMRYTIRSDFDQWIGSALQTSQCPKLFCNYLNNYEDVLIQRCGHCILGCEYEPFWLNQYRKKIDDDVCAWIVIHGPIVCKENHGDHDHRCDFKTYLHETYMAINATCGSGRCPRDYK